MRSDPDAEAKSTEAVVGAIVVDTDRVGFYAFSPNVGAAMASSSATVDGGGTTKADWLNGRAEQDPAHVLAAVRECVGRVVVAGHVTGARVVAVGVANHRGSVIAWDRHTGESLSGLILWSDSRAAATAEACRRRGGRNGGRRFRDACGLPISPCFSAFKIRWLLDNDDAIREAHRRGDCYFGTVDAWLVWNLTGGAKGGVFATDSTNAAHTFLMNINTLEWDKELLKYFDISLDSLPEIKSSSELYGYISDGPLEGVPITGVLGNRQASLIGHGCFRSGLTKVTLDDSGSVLTVTGEDKVFSDNGLLTTVAYHLDKKPVFALEGPIASVGESIKWYKRCLKFKETDCFIPKIRNTRRKPVYFVPAFNGLYAPYWRPEARCVLVGVDDYVVKDDVYRATMESVCYQVHDVLEAVNADLRTSVERLKVDGPLSGNEFVMQSLADITGVHVDACTSNETAALGSAIAAGRAAETGVWPDALCVPEEKGVGYDGRIPAADREHRVFDWKRALRRSFEWNESGKPGAGDDNRYWLAGAVAAVVGILLVYGYSLLGRRNPR